MNNDYIKSVIKDYYPNSVDDLIVVCFSDNEIVLRRDDSYVIWRILDGELMLFKRETGVELDKVKSIFRDIKISSIV